MVTLNYDLCMEMNAGADFHVETGIKKRGGEHQWDATRFTNLPNDTGRGKASVNLLKPHGSLDWQLDEHGRLVSVDIGQGVDMSKAALVLGRREKERGRFPPPYWWCKNEFLERSKHVCQIVVIGYGFADAEINDMLAEAMTGGNIEEVLVVGKFGGDIEREKREIGILLGGGDKLRLVESGAKEFLEGLGENFEVVAPGVGRVRV